MILENWPTLLLGAGGGFLTSSAVQYVQHVFNKKREKDRREEMWYTEVINGTRELKRRAEGLDASIDLPERVRTQRPDDIENKELAQIVTTLEELRKAHDQMPIQFYNSPVDEHLSEITRFYDSSTVGDDPENVIDFKEDLLENSRKTLDAIEEEFADAPALY